jgi:hypothetical protein
MRTHQFAKEIGHILHRDSQSRRVHGKMRFATGTDNEHARARFEEIMQGKDDILLRTGCGLPPSLEQLPIRFPSLIVPGLEMLREYCQQDDGNRNVRYQVYQAGGFISRVNETNIDALQETAGFMKSYLQAFVDEFYPNVASLVSFDFDLDVADEELEPMMDFLRTSTDPYVVEHVQKVRSYAGNKPGRGDPLRYTAANMYFNGLSHDIDNATAIIPVGGQKEAPFFCLTSLYCATKGELQANILPVTFNCQQTPPYYPYKTASADITLGNTQDGMPVLDDKTPRPVLSDYREILEPVGATMSRLIEMAQAVRQVHFLPIAEKSVPA